MLLHFLLCSAIFRPLHFTSFWPFLGDCIFIIFGRLAIFRRLYFYYFWPFWVFGQLYFYYFRPFWGLLGGYMSNIFGRLGHFQATAFLSFLAVLAIFRWMHFYFFRPFWAIFEQLHFFFGCFGLFLAVAFFLFS